MSHVDKIECDVDDLEAFDAAVKRLGGSVLHGAECRWYGRHAGDYKLPEGWTASDLVATLKNCPHVARFPNARYDVGLLPRKDGVKGFQPVWDFWQGGYGLRAAIGEGGAKFKQAYAIERAKMAARRKGLRTTETVKSDGTIKLTIQGR